MLLVSRHMAPDSFIILAGRRWKVRTVDQEHMVIDVIPADGGKPLLLDGVVGWCATEFEKKSLHFIKGMAPRR